MISGMAAATNPKSTSGFRKVMAPCERKQKGSPNLPQSGLPATEARCRCSTSSFSFLTRGLRLVLEGRLRAFLFHNLNATHGARLTLVSLRRGSDDPAVVRSEAPPKRSRVVLRVLLEIPDVARSHAPAWERILGRSCVPFATQERRGRT